MNDILPMIKVCTIVVNVLPLEEWMHMKDRRAVIYLHELLK